MELGPFVRQDQQHRRAFAQRQLHDGAPINLDGSRRTGQQVGTTKTPESPRLKRLSLIYLIIQVLVPARVGHEWSHRCGRFIDVELLHGGPLGLKGCSPAAYVDETNTITRWSLGFTPLGLQADV